ncbi:MAG: hypothetical protein FWD88_03875, partial [Treponema sp.]|nr:hypothetical protein [Treponema sp.]
MKNVFGIAVIAMTAWFSMAGCAAAPPRPTTEVFRAPWSAYTLIPSQNYAVVGAIALRNVNRITFLVDLMEQAIEMGGHDLINVRLAVTGAGTITGATAVVIRYTDETIDMPVHDFLPGGDFVTLFGVPTVEPAHGVRPARVVRVPWSAYAPIPGKRHVTVGAIALRGTNHATLLVDLKERAIEMGGHDIINVRLTMTDAGAIAGATAVA